jgi:uncharacterized protein
MRAAAARVQKPFIAMLKLPFKFDGHCLLNKPANGGWEKSDTDRSRARLGRGKQKKERTMFQGQINFETATPVTDTAIQDVLFERGIYWSSGRSGIVDLVAAHKWFNLAALKGRVDAIPMRREVAEMMSDVEIAAAQRDARAWMATAN